MLFTIIEISICAFCVKFLCQILSHLDSCLSQYWLDGELFFWLCSSTAFFFTTTQPETKNWTPSLASDPRYPVHSNLLTLGLSLDSNVLGNRWPCVDGQFSLMVWFTVKGTLSNLSLQNMLASLTSSLISTSSGRHLIHIHNDPRTQQAAMRAAASCLRKSLVGSSLDMSSFLLVRHGWKCAVIGPLFRPHL